MRLVRLTGGFPDIMFYVGMAITATTPPILHCIGMYIEKFRTYYMVQCAFYMAFGVLALLLVSELWRIFAAVLVDDAFVVENAAFLGRMGKYSFLITILSILCLFVALTPVITVIITVFSVADLFCFAPCLVSKQAIRYKQKDDLITQTGRDDMGIIINLDMVMVRKEKSLKKPSAGVDTTAVNLSILKNNKAKAIRFSILEAICKALDCRPGDILSCEQKEGEDENGR